MAQKEETNIIEGKDLTLSDFLDVLLSKKSKDLYPNHHFPTDEMMKEFLSEIHTKNDEYIKRVLRRFLIGNCTFNSDIFYSGVLARQLKNKEKDASLKLKTEQGKRLLCLHYDKNFLVWNGLHWILDLLPKNPKMALQVINAYLITNFWFLPDVAISGLFHSMAIIRAKFIKYNHKKEVFLDISPLDFEKIIYELYSQLEYMVELTKQSHDGGIDIIATKEGVTEKQTTLIQCKRLEKRKVTVDEVRSLLGVVSDKKSTKGVFICSTDYTSEAIKFAEVNPSIELINVYQLIELLNENFGIYWINEIDKIIKDIKNTKE